MRVFRDTDSSHFGFSVPLNNTKKLKSRKQISLEIRAENLILEQKKRERKPLRPTTNKKVEKQREKAKHLSDMFIIALKRQKEKQSRAKHYNEKVKPAMRFVKEMKKETYRYQDMQHAEYKPFNMYRYGAFENHVLMRSSEGLTAGNAWAGLRDSWKGFKICMSLGNERGMRFYGRGILKFAYLLEEVPIDLSWLGLKPYKEFF